jgi:hypothetical protein
MGRSGVKKQFWLTEEQARDLAHKASITSLSEVAVIRMLLAGYHPPVPPAHFHEDMSELLQVAMDLEIAAKKQRDPELRKIITSEAVALRDLRIELIRKYLTGERQDMKWQ